MTFQLGDPKRHGDHELVAEVEVRRGGRIVMPGQAAPPLAVVVVHLGRQLQEAMVLPEIDSQSDQPQADVGLAGYLG